MPPTRLITASWWAWSSTSGTSSTLSEWAGGRASLWRVQSRSYHGSPRMSLVQPALLRYLAVLGVPSLVSCVPLLSCVHWFSQACLELTCIQV